MPRRLNKSPADIKAARRARREAIERGDDEPPEDKDEFRNALARRIARFLGNREQAWRDCPERLCRRQRACVAPHIHCTNRPPPASTPEGVARAGAAVQRVLAELRARQEGS
jgi:hypothetical protein